MHAASMAARGVNLNEKSGRSAPNGRLAGAVRDHSACEASIGWSMLEKVRAPGPPGAWSMRNTRGLRFCPRRTFVRDGVC